jgi:hypothetical protein
MPRYRIAYSLESFGYDYFDADNLEHAKELIRQVKEFDIDEDDLPSYYRKTMGGEHSFESEIEEIN